MWHHALGLSATAIRYLDNQRDMADELFGGNVASEMTLGEAIVRGILDPPKYVLSVFSYQQELEKYEVRIQALKSKAARENADKYLEALRRALEKADGLDELFDKHMEERSGKYIVFYANHEHMQEMIGKVPEWFRKVDRKPHVYSAYSDDPETSRAFADFKMDNSVHLKLLFCIDMLNEGIHVDDVSGVILLRPTVSPIVYKQQIGRALSANKKKNAVIFDIVLNIENLCSIGAVEEEMQVAIEYYRSLGEGASIVNEQFKVVDEVRDCMELFNRLNDSLTASWDVMYRFAKRYFGENGDLEVPKRYLTPEGYSLGAWLNTQRLVRAGKTVGKLTDAQIKKLDAIRMRWESVRDLVWERNFAEAKRYYERNGNLLVSVADQGTNGVSLGRWIRRQREVYGSTLSEVRKRQLDELGMIWVPEDPWNVKFELVSRYYRENGHLRIPPDFVCEGVWLRRWLSEQVARLNGKSPSGKVLGAEQMEKLASVGIRPEANRSRGKEMQNGIQAL